MSSVTKASHDLPVSVEQVVLGSIAAREDDGWSGAPAEAVRRDATSVSGVDEEDVDLVLEDLLMTGRAYKPADDELLRVDPWDYGTQDDRDAEEGDSAPASDTTTEPPSDPVARAKAIGKDVEDLVADGLPLELIDGDHSSHDAITERTISFQEAAAAPFKVVFRNQLCIDPGAQVEVKAARRRVSNGGSSSARGRFGLKGRDKGQHADLVEAGAWYALAVYEPTGVGDAREVLAVALVPAEVLDEHVDGRWHEVDRHEGTRAHFNWSDVLSPRLVEGSGGGEGL